MNVFGWGLIVIGAITLYISFRICDRLSKRNFILLGFVFLLLVCINFPIYVISVNSVGSSIKMLPGDKYKATVVDCKVTEGRASGMSIGINSRASYKTVYYYTPIVEFKDNNNNIKKKEVNPGLYTRPQMGEIMAISDLPNKDIVYDISAAKSPFTGFLFFIQTVLLAASFFLTCYGFGVENTKNKKRTKWLLLISIFAGLFLYTINIIATANF